MLCAQTAWQWCGLGASSCQCFQLSRLLLLLLVLSPTVTDCLTPVCAACCCALQGWKDWLIEGAVFAVRQLLLWNTVSRQEYSVLRWVQSTCGAAAGSAAAALALLLVAVVQ